MGHILSYQSIVRTKTQSNQGNGGLIAILYAQTLLDKLYAVLNASQI